METGHDFKASISLSLFHVDKSCNVSNFEAHLLNETAVKDTCITCLSLALFVNVFSA